MSRAERETREWDGDAHNTMSNLKCSKIEKEAAAAPNHLP